MHLRRVFVPAGHITANWGVDRVNKSWFVCASEEQSKSYCNQGILLPQQHMAMSLLDQIQFDRITRWCKEADAGLLM